ncbi:hypothetical protein E4T38_02546 [Aureobasidium subglaciale]|nr:hypothetical protein E4T38_02546 [Aureobasidium subglaciale]KAI5228064.1 hypothetical protein E4T40_02325 [Aureobasidium subglaciale]KAI5231351.1 hypothetical protein E4T41_02545 [Aureobasidium subglaciale]KAI5265381.1 hypothetical protein E4T46_02323 [Aureobasidium subglaciale]
MPLMSRRRSTLDTLLNDIRSNAQEDAATTNSGYATPVPNTHRPMSAQDPISPMDALSLGPPSPPIQTATSSTARFSMLRWRHFSDGQLSAKARLHAEADKTPPVPQVPLEHQSQSTSPSLSQLCDSHSHRPAPVPTPQIITTAPTMDEHNHPTHRARKAKSPFKRQISKLSPSKQRRESTEDHRPWRRGRSVDIDRLVPDVFAPPPYGDESNSALALPITRLSDSSGEQRSSGEHVTYATTTTTHTISTTTTLFKLPRRNKKNKSLFPLPSKSASSQIPPETESPHGTPRPSTSAISTHSNIESPERQRRPPPLSALQRRHTEASRPRLFLSSSPAPAQLARSSIAALATHGGAPLFRNDSSNSTHSNGSSPVLNPPRRFGLRDRSSTVSSFGRRSEDRTPPTPPMPSSARNSTSTSGRTSLGGLLGFNRFRHNSDLRDRNSSPGFHTKSNSLSPSVNEPLVIPDREEGDTPGKYLERLQVAVSRSLIAGILSKSADPFAQAVLRSYCRKFSFFGEPIDMSLRKFLLEAELPKETQQVDRVVQAFADRYHECNPGIFMSPDQAYIIAFSLMMLHTDAFNKNNKRKMQKHDYIKNTSGQNVLDDVLGCFYDNICYTPFIHFEEEVDINGERLLTFKPKKSKLRGSIPDPGRKNSGPIDPYALICDGKLDSLRPSIKDSITMEDPYSYLGTANFFDMKRLQKAFVNTAILQIISARSRPAAFESQATRDNPSESAIGLVDLKVTKVGVLWRKSTKRKKTRSPWQEWGAILTGSQLYLFKNVTWVKGLMSQYHTHVKQEGTNAPVIFKPPIQDFKPDALIKTDDAVALLDRSYLKHKDAFTLVRHGGQEEVLLAENESEVNDWIALINYAAAFRSAGVRIRGFIGGTDTDVTINSRGRLNSTASVDSSINASIGSALNSTITHDGQITVGKRDLTPQLVRQVLAARRQIMLQTIVESEREVTDAIRNLENMMRNARHLLLLAPIQPKTREDVCHATARMDAMLKWVRRDIWRTKCHRDILSLDLQEDGDIFDSKLSSSIANNRKTSGLQKTVSKTSSAISQQPHPQSPTHSSRPNGGDGQGEGFFNRDVFKTPPEHALRFGDAWQLPSSPLELNSAQDDRRPSTASVPQSVIRKHSVAGMSVASSVQDGDRYLSSAASDAQSRHGRLTPTRSYETRDHEAALLARDPLAPSTSAATHSTAGISESSHATPESASKLKSGRRSLHRTLRDGRHDTSASQRHRRGKESASTIRSDGSRADDSVEATPGLERTATRFMVHGKQASVVTFGADWAEEKMRRELARNHSASTQNSTEESGPDANLQYHVTQALSSFNQNDTSNSDGPGTMNVRIPTVHEWQADPADKTPTAAVEKSLPDPFNLQHELTTPTLMSSDDDLDSYFDANSPRSDRVRNTSRKFSESNGLEDALNNAREAVLPEDLPLPSSPPMAVEQDHHDDNTIPFSRYIENGKLRELASPTK